MFWAARYTRSVDRGAWPSFVDGVTCLVNSVSVCTEKKRREREKREREKEERRAREKSRLIAGSNLQTCFSFFYPNSRLTYRQNVFLNVFPSKKTFFHTTRLIDGNLNEK